jgi:hypothetical protein
MNKKSKGMNKKSKGMDKKSKGMNKKREENKSLTDDQFITFKTYAVELRNQNIKPLTV